MKILIAYATKSGSCRECASLLSRELQRQEVTVCDLANNHPNVSDYDTVIIGGNIRFGKLDRRVYRFIDSNKDKLLKMKSAFFICNGFSDDENVDSYFKKCFPCEVIEKSVHHDTFGGELKPDKLHGIDKIIVKLILKANEENDEFAKPNILTESICRFADKIKEIC